MDFEIKEYKKRVLGLLYHPETHNALSAKRKLLYEIKKNKELYSKLIQLKEKKYSHSFTKEEVSLIVDYLCEP